MLWSFAVNAFVALFAVAGVIRGGIRGGLGVLLLSWTLPWCILLLFPAMDTARLRLPTIPIIVLAAVQFVMSASGKRQVPAMIAVLVFAQVVSVLAYYPLVKAYPFKNEIDGRALAAAGRSCFLPTAISLLLLRVHGLRHARHRTQH